MLQGQANNHFTITVIIIILTTTTCYFKRYFLFFIDLMRLEEKENNNHFVTAQNDIIKQEIVMLVIPHMLLKLWLQTHFFILSAYTLWIWMRAKILITLSFAAITLEMKINKSFDIQLHIACVQSRAWKINWKSSRSLYRHELTWLVIVNIPPTEWLIQLVCTNNVWSVSNL